MNEFLFWMGLVVILFGLLELSRGFWFGDED